MAIYSKGDTSFKNPHFWVSIGHTCRGHHPSVGVIPPFATRRVAHLVVVTVIGWGEGPQHAMTWKNTNYSLPG